MMNILNKIFDKICWLLDLVIFKLTWISIFYTVRFINALENNNNNNNIIMQNLLFRYITNNSCEMECINVFVAKKLVNKLLKISNLRNKYKNTLHSHIRQKYSSNTTSKIFQTILLINKNKNFQFKIYPNSEPKR